MYSSQEITENEGDVEPNVENLPMSLQTASNTLINKCTSGIYNFTLLLWAIHTFNFAKVLEA